LRFDVAEQALAGTGAQGAATLRRLVDLGVGVSLDDFGAGNSSLGQLTRLGISEVKLDPALMAGLHGNPDRSTMVTSLVRLAQSLGISSIAEGVETEAMAVALRAIGCEGAQGWKFAQPMNAPTATKWLAENLDGARSVRCRGPKSGRVREQLTSRMAGCPLPAMRSPT
jgi:EAL domain-containing protein (putative c-di-GMP-specific phosphodiesterase class I)